jgi:hypothetical protein
MCGEEECNELEVPIFEGSVDNKLRGLKADSSNTGFLYGFLVPKKGDITFKMEKWWALGKRWRRAKNVVFLAQ